MTHSHYHPSPIRRLFGPIRLKFSRSKRGVRSRMLIAYATPAYQSIVNAPQERRHSRKNAPQRHHRNIRQSRMHVLQSHVLRIDHSILQSNHGYLFSWSAQRQLASLVISYIFHATVISRTKSLFLLLHQKRDVRSLNCLRDPVCYAAAEAVDQSPGVVSSSSCTQISTSG